MSFNVLIIIIDFFSCYKSEAKLHLSNVPATTSVVVAMWGYTQLATSYYYSYIANNNPDKKWMIKESLFHHLLLSLASHSKNVIYQIHNYDQRELQCNKSDVRRLATLVECSKKLLANLAMQLLDVAVPCKCVDNSLIHSKNCFPLFQYVKPLLFVKTHHIDINCEFEFRCC